jgi:hypothetical protein
MLMIENADHLVNPAAGWSRDQVRTLVRAIVCRESGIKDTFDDEAGFVHDLGIN